MRKLIAIVPLLVLALTLNAETAREKIEGDILTAYRELGFYDGSSMNMDWMLHVTVSAKEPYNIYIYFRKNMPQRRYIEAIILGVATVGKVTGKIKEKTFTVWFSIWDADHKTFRRFATILAYNCRKFLTLKTEEERKAFLKECLIFYE
ncbi:hypothetical protein ES703_49577 [subsurface metagenome]